MRRPPRVSTFFFFNDTATTEIYTLSLHDALPISVFSSHMTSMWKFMMNESQGGKSMFLSTANCGLNNETPSSKCLLMTKAYSVRQLRSEKLWWGLALSPNERLTL